MNRELKTKLHEAIESEIDRFLNAEDGSDEQKESSDNFVKFIKLDIEDNRIEYESNDKYRSTEIAEDELKFKKEELEHKKNESMLRTVLDGLKIGSEVCIVALNLHALTRHLKDMYKFEETGTICADASKKVSNMIPKLFKIK